MPWTRRRFEKGARRVGVVLASLALAIACDARTGADGTPDPQPENGRRLGPDGGVVHSASGALSLHVPAGALTEPVTISALADADAAHEWMVPGTAYRLEPAGLTFASPALLTLRYDPDVLEPIDAARSLRVYRAGDDVWRGVPGGETLADEHLVRVPIDGFSTFAVMDLPEAQPVPDEEDLPPVVPLNAHIDAVSASFMPVFAFATSKQVHGLEFDRVPAAGLPMWDTDECGFRRGGEKLPGAPPSDATFRADGSFGQQTAVMESSFEFIDARSYRLRFDGVIAAQTVPIDDHHSPADAQIKVDFAAYPLRLTIWDPSAGSYDVWVTARAEVETTGDATYLVRAQVREQVCHGVGRTIDLYEARAQQDGPNASPVAVEHLYVEGETTVQLALDLIAMIVAFADPEEGGARSEGTLNGSVLIEVSPRLPR